MKRMDIKEIREITASARRAIADAASAEALESVRVHYLGRKGLVTEFLRTLKELSLEERRKAGPFLQEEKRNLEESIAARQKKFGNAKSPEPDLTAPAARVARGHLHPLTKADQDIRRIFLGMNFSVIEGPEVESEYYNFDALNIAANHPARDMWDTFWLKEKRDEKKENRGSEAREASCGATRFAPGDRLLLRTHTSPVQMRYMEAHTPPFQIIVPGRAFRYEATDASHEINFYQIEGLMVGKDVSLANFKFVIEAFFKKFFRGTRIEFRYRPSYFPFVEPGLEVDIKLGAKWLEVMGAGMVHPRVFEYAHYNPRDWQGFAFGGGIDRLAMIKYGIPDIRLFYSGDLRFIRQF